MEAPDAIPPILPAPTGAAARSRTPAPSGGRPPASQSAPDAFRTLLADLEGKVRALGAQARSVEGAADLAGAVHSARQPLEQVLSLGDQLLEAFRASARTGSEEGEARRP